MTVLTLTMMTLSLHSLANYQWDQERFESPTIDGTPFLAYTSEESASGKSEKMRKKRANQFCKARGYDESDLSLVNLVEPFFFDGKNAHYSLVTYKKDATHPAPINGKMKYKSGTWYYAASFQEIVCFRKQQTAALDNDRNAGKEFSSINSDARKNASAIKQ